MEDYKKNKSESLINAGDNEWNNLLVILNNNDFFKNFNYLDDEEKYKRLNEYSYKLGLILEYYLKALYLEQLEFPIEYIDIINERIQNSNEAKKYKITKITDEDIVNIIIENRTDRTDLLKKLMKQNNDGKPNILKSVMDLTFKKFSHRFSELISRDTINEQQYVEILNNLNEINFIDKPPVIIAKYPKGTLIIEPVMQLLLKQNSNLKLCKDNIHLENKEEYFPKEENVISSYIEKELIKKLSAKDISEVFINSRYSVLSDFNPQFIELMKLCSAVIKCIDKLGHHITFNLCDNYCIGEVEKIQDKIVYDNIDNKTYSYDHKTLIKYNGKSRKPLDINDEIIIIRNNNMELIKYRGLTPNEKMMSYKQYEDDYNLHSGLVKFTKEGKKIVDLEENIKKEDGIIIIREDSIEYYICTNGGLMKVQEEFFNKKYNYPLETNEYKELNEQKQDFKIKII